MLLRSQDAGRGAALRLPPDRSVIAGATDAAARIPRADVRSSRSKPAVLRNALQAVDPALNSRVAGAQKSADYLDRLGAELGSIRSALRDRLQLSSKGGSAAEASSPHSVESKIRRFADLWSRRGPESAGTLDPMLRYPADGVARQTFKVRGLDLATLRAGKPEIISLSVGGQGLRGPASVAVEPGLSDPAIARRFDRALAGSGVRAQIGEDGELHFSVAESDWPKVRDSLAVRGEGQRFPTGRFSPVRALADPSAIRPEEWKTHDEAALRSTRESVFMAEGAVRRARRVVDERLAEAGRSFQTRDTIIETRAREAATFAEGVGRMLAAAAEGNDYGALAAVLPAVSKVDRDRVATLLGG